MGGQWSTYWYNGYIYGSEIARGVDVFKLVPNKFLTQNEIDASNQVHYDELNVQNQPHVIWPANFIVARAYVDQLERSNAISSARIAALNAAIPKAEAGDKKELAALKSMVSALEKDAKIVKTPGDADRLTALASIIKQQK
jgi:hypothetical protein